MQTEVVMKRQLFNHEIGQKSQSEFLSATDLVRAGNAWRISQMMEPFSMDRWFQNKGVKEFIAALEKKTEQKVKISARGRGHHTWVHPYLFIDMALAINPELKVEVYGWLKDYLLKYRNDSGDSYKLMSGALYANSSSQSTFYSEIKKHCEAIRIACGVEDWNRATEDQLKLRDKIHNNIYLLCDILRDNEVAVRQAILKATDQKLMADKA